MTEGDIRRLEQKIGDGFQSVNDRLDDIQIALGGLMSNVLHPSEVENIRSKMKRPFPVETFPPQPQSRAVG